MLISPLNVVLAAYFALFVSQITYALTIWGHSCHTNNIFKLQRRVVRVIAKKGYRDEIKSKFTKLKLLTFPSLYIFHSIIEIKKDMPQLKKHSEVHMYSTRNNNDLLPNFLRLKVSRNCYNYCGIHFINKLPKDLLCNSKLFRLKLETYLVEKAFFSVKEFLETNLSNADFAL